MVTSVNTNVNAMAAVQALSDISNQMTNTQSHIESGLKVSGAADNPAVFTIAQGLRANIGALGAVSDSLATGVATLQSQVAGATSISSALNTLLKTVTQSEGQTDAASVAANNTTITNALKNIDAFVSATTLNGVNLLKATPDTLSVISNVDGTATSVVGANSTAAGLGLTAAATTVDGTEATTKTVIATVNAAITTINATLTKLGSATVQVQGIADFTAKLSSSASTALGAMVDANLSEESAKLSSLQTKQSLAIQSLSLANQGPSSLLQLFR